MFFSFFLCQGNGGFRGLDPHDKVKVKAMLKWWTHPPPPQKNSSHADSLLLCAVWAISAMRWIRISLLARLFTPEQVCSFVWRCLHLIQLVWLHIVSEFGSTLNCKRQIYTSSHLRGLSWFYWQWLFRGQADVVRVVQANFIDETFGLFLFPWLPLLLLLCLLSFFKF